MQTSSTLLRASNRFLFADPELLNSTDAYYVVLCDSITSDSFITVADVVANEVSVLRTLAVVNSVNLNTEIDFVGSINTASVPAGGVNVTLAALVIIDNVGNIQAVIATANVSQLVNPNSTFATLFKFSIT